MDTSALKKFAQSARQELLEQVGSRLAFVLKPESPARRECPMTVNQLEKAMTVQGKAGLIDQVAYTWFNRFCALRFMDVNGYNRVGVLSPSEGQIQPEILAEAKSGIIDDTQFNRSIADQVRGLLGGSISSQDAQAEAYRLLIVGSCNSLFEHMPFLFERIQDFTELLMPDDLLSENSILAKMRVVMTPETCQDVEIIGWLYQFYISEKKDEVFAGLKKNQKITAENIPAATQLFTPHWIVRYLVENSLGQLWLLNRPSSKLAVHMDYYIAPEQPESDFLKISRPEEIKVLDPAVGSGHMLTYAFDLLYTIYEEEGYDPNEIPGLIIKHNLYGIEIDGRAGALASFALEMKVAEKLGRRRFFRLNVKPNICVLEDVIFLESEMDDVKSIVAKELYTADLRETLIQFEQATNFGSLIVPTLKDPAETARLIEAKDFSGDLLLTEVHERVVKVLCMAEYLSPKYHVVVANPPYMGAKGMNETVSAFLKEAYNDEKLDLFSCFIARSELLARRKGYRAMVTMESWMFLSTFEALREKILSKATITSLVHMPYLGSGGTSMGISFGTAAFILLNEHRPNLLASYQCIRYYETDDKAVPVEFPTKNERYRILSTSRFENVPGKPISYWMSDGMISAWERGETVKDITISDGQNKTGENAKYLRFHWELSRSKFKRQEWITYAKGGEWRRWFGNVELLINWSIEARSHYRKDKIARLIPEYLWYRSGVTWSFIATKNIGFRFLDEGGTFDVQGSTLFFDNPEDILSTLALLNSKPAVDVLKTLNPTMSLQVKNARSIPIPQSFKSGIARDNAQSMVSLAREDWNAEENANEFTTLPLLQSDHWAETLEATYTALRANWRGMTDEMQRLEKENNRTFIDAYGLQDELTPDVPIKEITLTCNPAYRYGIKNDTEANETRLRADTMAEFLSYAVGCVFGRYSLDKPGFILANQGETLADYLASIPEPTFMPDEDNVIPMIDFEGDWFQDDICERFKQFLRITFGDEHYAENLAFIENALGKSIQKYFAKDFYNDHVKRYKKRPIYWLFSSPKGTFNALIYMHRYTRSTVSVVLNEYLRDFRTKLEARKNNYNHILIISSASQKEKADASKRINKLDQAIVEINAYEREVLYPLAGQNLVINLDDGVKHNYPLFGTALKKITGLS